MSEKTNHDACCEQHNPPLHTLPGLHFTTLPGNPTINPYHLHPYLLSGGYREESDSLGKISVPSRALWGASTQRALEHLPLNLPEDRLPYKVVVAVATVKRAVAVVCGEGRVGETDGWSYEYAEEGGEMDGDAVTNAEDALQRGICPPWTHTGAACGNGSAASAHNGAMDSHGTSEGADAKRVGSDSRARPARGLPPSPSTHSTQARTATGTSGQSQGVLSPLKALCIALAAEEVMGARMKTHSWRGGATAERMRNDMLSGAVSVSQALKQVHREPVEGSEGDLRMHFPLSVWQTGSGTHTNMNVNEVVARRANIIVAQLELATGAAEGADAASLRIHPNDDVNICQSSNDVMPTAIYLAAAVDARRLAELCRRLSSSLAAHALKTRNVIKLGRTHLRDATPIPLATELSCFVEAAARAAAHLDRCAVELCEVPLGGTAVGTGLNTYRGFATAAAAELAHVTGLPVRALSLPAYGLSLHTPLARLSSEAALLASVLVKLANDWRFYDSGPRGGLREYHMQPLEPGSSIMPGKFNPTQCESLAQVCLAVMAQASAAITGNALGQCELNAYKPLMGHCALQGCERMAQAVAGFTRLCVCSLQFDEAAMRQSVEESLMLVTGLNNMIGYSRAAVIAKYCNRHGLTLRQALVEDLQLLDDKMYDTLLGPHTLVAPVSIDVMRDRRARKADGGRQEPHQRGQGRAHEGDEIVMTEHALRRLEEMEAENERAQEDGGRGRAAAGSSARTRSTSAERRAAGSSGGKGARESSDAKQGDEGEGEGVRDRARCLTSGGKTAAATGMSRPLGK